jgi:hypothetical protein
MEISLLSFFLLSFLSLPYFSAIMKAAMVLRCKPSYLILEDGLNILYKWKATSIFWQMEDSIC